jgi:hypothetical protein
MSLNANPSASPNTPAVPSTAPTSDVASRICSAASTPIISTIQRTVVRVSSVRNGLRFATRLSSERRESQLPSNQASQMMTSASSSNGRAASSR